MAEVAKNEAAADSKVNRDSNPRGIPVAPFVEDVESFVSSRSEIEPNLKKFQEMIAKYQFMEINTQRRAAGLKDKIPDIRKTLETVQFLIARGGGGVEDVEKKSFDTTFELNDTLYAKATIDGSTTDEVYLWLGANVMLAYPIEEAKMLLEGKLSAALESLKNCEEDMDFLRQQITTLEVNTARLYNYEVTLKRRDRAEAEEEEKRKKK
ncbi:Prefoldin subunit domain-containing protein [Sphaerosporella brunnea]|uniref:Prefoldin subunit 3 n=1 Tax=Sphaerosporella brunnea TaxID=1250544 RepID=A0A5J5EQA6_9PEZI|nr:Prefoldin subunit domain-containing protein [Sphaerosporella brunnea]